MRPTLLQTLRFQIQLLQPREHRQPFSSFESVPSKENPLQ